MHVELRGNPALEEAVRNLLDKGERLRVYATESRGRDATPYEAQSRMEGETKRYLHHALADAIAKSPFVHVERREGPHAEPRSVVRHIDVYVVPREAWAMLQEMLKRTDRKLDNAVS
jgi:hypothetical protein